MCFFSCLEWQEIQISKMLKFNIYSCPRIAAPICLIFFNQRCKGLNFLNPQFKVCYHPRVVCIWICRHIFIYSFLLSLNSVLIPHFLHYHLPHTQLYYNRINVQLSLRICSHKKYCFMFVCIIYMIYTKYMIYIEIISCISHHPLCFQDWYAVVCVNIIYCFQLLHSTVWWVSTTYFMSSFPVTYTQVASNS